MPALMLQSKRWFHSNGKDAMLREAVKAASPAVLVGSAATLIALFVTLAPVLM